MYSGSRFQQSSTHQVWHPFLPLTNHRPTLPPIARERCQKQLPLLYDMVKPKTRRWTCFEKWLIPLHQLTFWQHSSSSFASFALLRFRTFSQSSIFFSINSMSCKINQKFLSLRLMTNVVQEHELPQYPLKEESSRFRYWPPHTLRRNSSVMMSKSRTGSTESSTCVTSGSSKAPAR